MSRDNLDFLLCAFLLITNGFWAYQCHSLMNKLMCKDFGEYQYYTTKTKDVPRGNLEQEDLASIEQENQDYLSELNGIFPK